MADLFALSSRIIDEGLSEIRSNRITHELSELQDNLAMVEAFSHSVIFQTEEGLVVFDTSGAQGGRLVVDAIRGWSKQPFHSVVYTHGHIDHVGGSGAFVADAQEHSHALQVIGHENIPHRFARYDLTNDYNCLANARQFQGRHVTIGGAGRFLPASTAWPNRIYAQQMQFQVGSLKVELHHAQGETDDHTWAWIPQHKAICAGDFFVWVFPNAGNPQKVQRYPMEWAAALRQMAAMEAEMLLPAHGLPIAGPSRIRTVLTEVAETLENLVKNTLALMNGGARLNEIVHAVKVPQEILEKPYMKPVYDEPEFIVNNIWRLYGGWYDGNPAQLKPAAESAFAQEIVQLSGGAKRLIQRAETLADAGDFRLACHLIEIAVSADWENGAAHSARSEIYQRRREAETSLMAKGIFGHTAAESEAKVGSLKK